MRETLGMKPRPVEQWVEQWEAESSGVRIRSPTGKRIAAKWLAEHHAEFLEFVQAAKAQFGPAQKLVFTSADQAGLAAALQAEGVTE